MAYRWQATLIDFIFLYIVAISIQGVVESISNTELLVLSIVVFVFYFIVLESLGGITLGKLLSGLRVVNANGETPSVSQVTIRTLLRIVEVNPILLGGLPAAVFVLMSKKQQRLGDMLANTYVVDKHKLQDD